MRPYETNYDDFDELDDFGYPEVRAIRHMENERRRDELRLRKRRRPFRKDDQWHDDDWSDYADDYLDDYDAIEFDTYSGLRIEHR